MNAELDSDSPVAADSRFVSSVSGDSLDVSLVDPADAEAIGE